MLEVSQTGFERYLVVEIQTVRVWTLLGRMVGRRESLAEEKADATSDARCALQLRLAAQLPDAQLPQMDHCRRHGGVSHEGMQFALRQCVGAMTRPGIVAFVGSFN